MKIILPDAQTPPETQQLDITAEVCPLTFVRTRLALERAAPGGVLAVRLKGAEPVRNVPRSVAELGHEVLALAPETAGEDPANPQTVFRLVIRRR